MKQTFLIIGAIFPAVLAPAATHLVLPDGSIQEKIDLAVAGDIIAISGGSYNEDLTIDKAIRLVEVQGEEVVLPGSVTFQGVVGAPPFEGFTVGSVGKGIVVNNTTGLVLKDVDAGAGDALRVNGVSEVGLAGGSYNGIVQDGGSLTLSRVTLTQNGSVVASSNCEKTVVFRTVVTGDPILFGDFLLDSQRVWVGYSKFRWLRCNGDNSKIVVVGCEIGQEGGGDYDWVIVIGGTSNRFSLVNSVLKGLTYGTYGPGLQYRGSSSVVVGTVHAVSSHTVLIANNYFVGRNNSGAGPFDGAPDYEGTAVYSTSPDCTVQNNILHNIYHGVRMPFGAICRNNFLVNVPSWKEKGGVVPINWLSGDPLFIEGGEPKLQAGSPCIDAGFDDPIYNDLDESPYDASRYGPRGGARNNIGPSGGPWFDPDGWTTDKPVVISFDLSPQRLQEGVDAEVRISEGVAVEQP